MTSEVKFDIIHLIIYKVKNILFFIAKQYTGLEINLVTNDMQFSWMTSHHII